MLKRAAKRSREQFNNVLCLQHNPIYQRAPNLLSYILGLPYGAAHAWSHPVQKQLESICQFKQSYAPSLWLVTLNQRPDFQPQKQSGNSVFVMCTFAGVILNQSLKGRVSMLAAVDTLGCRVPWFGSNLGCFASRIHIVAGWFFT